MGKSADAFRTISEVADWLEVPAHVLRFWESKFTQVKPVKRAGGRRYYRPGDMRLLGGIKILLHDEGLTIKGVQKVLRDEGVSHVAALSPAVEHDDTAPAPAAPTAAQVLSFARPDTPPDTDTPLETGAAPKEPDTDETPEPQDTTEPEAEHHAPEPDAEPAPDPAPDPEPETATDPAPEPDPAPKPEPEPETTSKPEPAAPAAKPATPRLPPLPDLPPDPPDDAPAATGPLARLATLARPLPPDLAASLAALADRLRDAPAPKA